MHQIIKIYIVLHEENYKLNDKSMENSLLERTLNTFKQQKYPGEQVPFANVIHMPSTEIPSTHSYLKQMGQHVKLLDITVQLQTVLKHIHPSHT